MSDGHPRVPAALAWSALSVITVLTFALPSEVDVDLWGHMAMGRETLRQGWPPTQDPFSYVPTFELVVYHEWLSGVLFYVVLMQFGSGALKVLLVALAVLTLTFAGLASRSLGASPVATFVVVLVALPSLGMGYLPIRPQVFTFFFCALFLFLLVRAERGSRYLLLLIPPLTVLWANLHGGFVAGLGLVLVYVVGQILEGKKPWLGISACSAAIIGTLLNPYGLDYWSYLWRALLMPRPLIKEWAPLYRYAASDWFAAVLVLIAALSLIVAPKRNWPGVLVLAATAFFGLRHVKHIPLFAIATVAFVPGHLSVLLDRVVEAVWSRRVGHRVLMTRFASIVLLAVTLVLGFDVVLFTRWRLAVLGSAYPVGAVEFLQLNGLRGNLATPFQWGQYVLWKLYPHVKVSFDGRYETVYPDEVTRDNFNFMYGRGDWRRLLRDYPTEMVLVSKDFPMAPLMSQEPGWAVVYQDRVSALYLPERKSQGPWRVPKGPRGTIP